jgi:alkylation response protein AidB-like acyl-CoA dehydrogenase
MNKSFAETAMELSGKTAAESTSIGKVDMADDQVEELFDDKHQTKNSPAYKAVWNRKFPAREFFEFDFHRPNAAMLGNCLDIVRQFKSEERLYDNGKLSGELITALAGSGYFGLLVPLPNKPALSFSEFSSFLTEMARIEPSVAGMCSIHGCIGSVDPVRTFGDDHQKEKYLPGLSDGTFLSAFALTEPCAGSDLTALRTNAKIDGDDYVLNGTKLFITNVYYGGLVSVVCIIEGKPQVLLVEIPDGDTDTFNIGHYKIHALARLNNNSLIFTNHRVPKENLIRLNKGDGLTVAYHGLNLGRISLCANASGCMKTMLDSMLPWADYRSTYGKAIKHRELVQERISRLAGYILSSDALVAWCSGLIDKGYRGELECIIAKTFGSECQKEAAIDLCMKTHGGRSFLGGHIIGDNIHDILAPLIYEGEGDMLNMAFFKSLVKEHGKTFFEPVGQLMSDLGKKSPSLMDIVRNHKTFMPYANWMVKEMFLPKSGIRPIGFNKALAKHADFAVKGLQKSGQEISGLMRKYQLGLADKQCRMSILSRKIQNLTAMMATVCYAFAKANPLTAQIADVSCENLKNKITGNHPTDAQIKKSVRIGEVIAGRGIELGCDSVLMGYDR